jgi:hypothetical protein
MTDRVIRPSMRQVKMWCCAALLVILAAVFVHVRYLMPRDEPPWLRQSWLPAVAALVFLVPPATTSAGNRRE